MVHDYVGDDAELIDRPSAGASPAACASCASSPGTGRPVGAAQPGLARGARAARRVHRRRLPRRPGVARALVAAAEQAPGAILQGTTRPDPYEMASLASPHARSLWVTPPDDYRADVQHRLPGGLLERVGGFDEELPAPAGEDTDLALRARAAGRRWSAAPRRHGLPRRRAVLAAVDAIKLNLKWRHLAFVIKRHPELRAALHQPDLLAAHAPRPGCCCCWAALLASRFPAALLLGGPWMYRRLTRRGRRKRALVVGRRRAARAAWSSTWPRSATMCWGSATYRTLVL